MFAIKQFQKEDGFGLLNTLMVVVALGLMGGTLVILLISDLRMQVLNVERSRAFYAANSGIEYAIRGISEFAGHSQHLGNLNHYKETLDTGNGTRCEIAYHLIGKDSLEITSTGFTQTAVHTLKKAINFTNISDYAVYATGKVRYVRVIPEHGGTNPAHLIKENAKTFPLFDYNALRKLAKPGKYFTNNLTLNGFFYNSRPVTFVEKNLTFGRFNWFNFGNFVVGGRTLIKRSWFPLGFTRGNVLQFTKGKPFISEVQFFWREIYGGLIINGDVIGTTNPHWFYRFAIRQNRAYINNILKYSVNGGPLVFNNSIWQVVQ